MKDVVTLGTILLKTGSLLHTHHQSIFHSILLAYLFDIPIHFHTIKLTKAHNTTQNIHITGILK